MLQNHSLQAFSYPSVLNLFSNYFCLLLSFLIINYNKDFQSDRIEIGDGNIKLQYDEEIEKILSIEDVSKEEMEKLQNISKSGEIQVWIEKYGSLKGLLHPAITTGAALKLLCFEENGELLYQNTEYNTCHLVKTDKKSLTTKPQFILLSSMDKGTVLIQNETDTHGQIRFFDANGKQIFHSPLNASNIQLCLPQSGLIFYRFETESGEIQNGKIWVN